MLYAVNFEWVFHLLLSISNVMQRRLIRGQPSTDILSFSPIDRVDKMSQPLRITGGGNV